MDEIVIAMSALEVRSTLSGGFDEAHGEYGAELVICLSRNVGLPSETRIDLVNNERLVNIENIALHCPLRSDVSRSLYETGRHVCAPMTAVCVSMCARRCLSDSGENVRKLVGYAFPPILLSELKSGAVIERAIIDLSAVNEKEIADDQHTRALKQDFTDQFTKGFIKITVGDVRMPAGFEVGVDPRWRIEQITESTLKSVPPKERALVQYGAAQRYYCDGPRTNSSARVPTLISDYYKRVYDPYVGNGGFKRWEPLEERWRCYVVPHYVLGSGMYAPSAAALCCSLNDVSPEEDLLLQQLGISLVDHQFTNDEEFEHMCRGLVKAGALRTAPGQKRPVYLDPRCIEALQAICEGLFTNITTTMAYTNDETRDRSKRVVETDHLCTDICDLMGCDCEDGACAHVRRYFAVVRNKNTWRSRVMRAASAVLDIYRVVCTKMFCCGETEAPDAGGGICHVHSSLVHADYLCAMLVDGLDSRVQSGEITQETAIQMKVSVRDICYWPEWVYVKENGERSYALSTHPSSSVDEVSNHYKRRMRWLPTMKDLINSNGDQFVCCGVPSTLYLESTTPISPFQMPLDKLYDPRSPLGREHLECLREKTIIAGVLRSKLDYVLAKEWVHNGVWCTETSERVFAVERSPTTAFYKAHCSMSFVNVACVVAHRDDTIESNARGTFMELNDVTPRMKCVFDSGEQILDAITNMSNHPKTFGIYHKHYASGSVLARLIPNTNISCHEFIATQYAMSLERGIASLLSVDDLHVHLESIDRSRALRGVYNIVSRELEVLCIELRPHLKFLTVDALERVCATKTLQIVGLRVECTRLGRVHIPIQDTRRMSYSDFKAAMKKTGLSNKDALELERYTNKADALRVSAVLGESQHDFVHDLYDFILRVNNLSVVRVFVYVKRKLCH
jgi:hypothetical protein